MWAHVHPLKTMANHGLLRSTAYLCQRYSAHKTFIPGLAFHIHHVHHIDFMLRFAIIPGAILCRLSQLICWHFCQFKALHSWVWKLFCFPLCCPARYLEFQLAYTWTRPATPISAWQALEWSTIPKMMGILGPQGVFSHLPVTCRPATFTKPENQIKAAANSPSAKQVAKKWKMWYVATKSKP